MQIYNIMSCSGFGYEFFGGCTMAWLGLVALFFIIALLRKWGGEEAGLDFSFVGALVVGFLSDLAVVTFTGSFKWALAAGIIGAVVGGYGLGFFGIGGGDDDY